MDVNKSIRYVFDDPQWISKVVIGALLSILGFLIVPALILQGYVVKIIRQVMNGDWDGLPEWDDWGGLLRDGFNVFIAELVYVLPFIILMIIGLLTTGGAASLAGGEDLTALLATGGALLFICLVFLFAIAFLFLAPAILIQYAIKGDLGSMFRFGEVFAIIRNNMADILVAFLVTLVAAFAVSLVGGVLAIIPCLGWIAAFIISLAAGPYISFVGGHLYGQIAAKILGNKAGGTYTDAA